jgi:hypothetical protein
VDARAIDLHAPHRGGSQTDNGRGETRITGCSVTAGFWSGWPDLNRRPLRPELAALLGVCPLSQLTQGVGGSSCLLLSGGVAVLCCCTGLLSVSLLDSAKCSARARRPSVFQAAYPQVAARLASVSGVADRRGLPLVAAVAVTVAVSSSPVRRLSVAPGNCPHVAGDDPRPVRAGSCWPLVSDRRGCRGSDAQGRVLKIISAERILK